MKSVKKGRMVAYFFILPAFIIHMCIVTGPALSTLVMSLFDWNGMGNAKFIGLDNFKEIFIANPMSPYDGAAVAGRIWTAYMNPYYGVNQVFARLGWEDLSKVLWLGNPKIALYAVAFVDNWHWWGFIMVLFLGALQQIDPTLYEAARVDGANRFQELLHVSIPGIRQTIAFVLIMTIMWSFLTFDYVYVMTNGGPANSTEIMATYIYKNAFVKYRAGYANALCVIQSGICILLYFLQKYVSKKGGMDDE